MVCGSTATDHDIRQHRNWDLSAAAHNTNNEKVQHDEGMQVSDGQGSRDLRQGRGHRGRAVDVPEVQAAGAADIVSSENARTNAWVRSELAKMTLKVGAEELRKIRQQLDLENGKYTLIQFEDGTLEALRYGEPWRTFVGDKFIGCVAEELFVLKQLHD